MRILMLSILATLFAVSPALGNEQDERRVEELARNLRINIYQTYRTNRAEYDRRMEIANEALRRFKFAKTDDGSQQMLQWFADVEDSSFNQLSAIPEIQLADVNERFQRKRRQKKQKVAQNQQRTKEGFVKTAFQKKSNGITDLVSNSGNSQPSEETSGSTSVSGLFKNIGKSFLRKGPSTTTAADSKSDDPAALEGDESSEAAASDIGNEASSDADDAGDNTEWDVNNDSESAGASTDFETLEGDIVNYNLTVELLHEDFLAMESHDVESLTQFIERIETYHTQYQQLQSRAQLRSDAEQAQLSSPKSLENIATDFMTAVNELSLSSDADDEAGKVDSLRQQISQVLAVHAS